MGHSRLIISLLAVVLAVVLAACTQAPRGDVARPTRSDLPAPQSEPAATPGSDRPAPDTIDGEEIVLASALQPFDSCAGLLDYFKTEALKVVGPYGLDGLAYPMAVDAMAGVAESSAGAARTTGAPNSAVSADSAKSPPVAGQDFSGTNVQEKGVDEPDSVKTNGKLVISVSGEHLHIVDLDRPSTVLSKVKLQGWGHQLLLDGDRLLVMGSQEGDYGIMRDLSVRSSVPAGGSAVSVLTLIDIADPAQPEVEATLTLDGGYHSARMVDGTARVVLTSRPTGLAFKMPEGGGLRAERQAEEANRKVIRSSTIDNWLPYYVLADQRDGQKATSDGTLLDCANISRPGKFAGLGLLSVLSVDLGASLVPEGGTAIVATGETVYASRDTMYIATNQWFDPAAVEGGGSGLLPEDYRTEIHAFDITDPTAARYVASGVVRGHLLNQFSMSEHEGHLRVATTDGAPWGDASESFVTVLKPDGERLVRVGQVGNLGRNERIYSVRFLGDVGYVVTFRQTDPLYTIDLSTPAAPKVTGELKILGYSAYLHPINDDLLLGVGQDADKQGRTRGTQLSLFDVSNPAAPTRLRQTKITGGSSEAEYDHHAFLYWPASQLAVIPVQTYTFAKGIENVSAGAMAFRVTRDGIAQKATVRHVEQGNNPDAWRAMIRRSLVVDDTLVTVSELGLMVSDLNTLKRQAFARFR